MDAQDSKVSSVFRELADVLETFEATKTDLSVTQATPVGDDFLDAETVSVEVGTRIPFLENSLENTSGEETNINLTPTSVCLDGDGSLHIKFQATAEFGSELVVGEEATSVEIDRDTEPDTISEPEESVDEPIGGDASPKQTATMEAEIADKKHSEQQDAKTRTEASDKNGAHLEMSVAATNSQEREEQDKDAEISPYRDPERLQEVYDEYETFDEMTDALGADVTSQTVRRYMIKHDIHTPASKTGSHSAEMLLDMDPDSITPEKPDSETDDKEDGAHPSNRQTPTFRNPT